METAWAALLFSLAVATFSIPLWPAFVELRRRKIQILHINRQDDRTSGYAAMTALRKNRGATALGDLRVAADTSASVVKCTRDLHLSSGTGIEAACARNIFLESNVTVFDVASASRSLWVQPHCQFRWLDAPMVTFTDRDEQPLVPPLAFKAAPALGSSSTAEKQGKFTRIEGRWQPDPAAVIAGDFVVTGEVDLPEGCKLTGSIKAYGNVKVGRSSIVQGSVFSQGDIELAELAQVQGVVSAARKATLLRGSVIGREDQLGSVSAQHIEASAGACVFGSVHARVNGVSQP